MTLKERLGDRYNSLNAVRLLLAALVVLAHAWPLTGAPGPGLGFLSGMAVNGFFVASGYLIAESRVRTRLVPYLWRRFLRIYPAFLVCLIAVAFIFAPIAALIEGAPFNFGSAAGFVVHNSGLWMAQGGIEGLLTDVPFPLAWNGSLWTLSFEAMAYVLLGLLLSLSVAVRHARWVLPALCLAVILFRPVSFGYLDLTGGFERNALRLASYFLAGAAIWAWADSWRPTRWQIVAAAAIYATMITPGWADYFGQLPLAVLVLGLGSMPARNWTTRTDLSYGLYIYAFPVQQMLVLLGTASWGVAANSVLVLLLTLPLALLSWKVIEKPALKAKAWADPRHRPDRRVAPAVDTAVWPADGEAKHRT